MTAIKYRTTDLNGLRVFYREAGTSTAPKLLLLHGFPSVGHMFRDLIPLLTDHFHMIAPDWPGFGQTDMPARHEFTYTFDQIANVIDHFTEVVGFDRFAVYVFDYGAPTGFRLAVKHPERITTIISQNGNAYEEGLSEEWNPIRAYWQHPSQANREVLRQFLAPQTTRWQYLHGGAFEPMPVGDPFGDVRNNMPKYVVSTTLASASAWRNSTLISCNVVEEVRTLKAQPGKNILIDGSSVLVHTLAEHDLIDEYSLWIYPVVLSSGKKLFPEGLRVNLRLIESKPLPSGVVLMFYARA